MKRSRYNFMKKSFKFYLIFMISIFAFDNSLAVQSDPFLKGKLLFDKKDYEKSKFFFEKDIVFNPKSEKSYLFLAKIFNKKENEKEEEKNLNAVLLLNPKNDEAIYLLTLLKIKQSDYDEAKELMKQFKIVCNLFCSKEKEMQKKFNKLVPENEKN